MSTVLIAGSTAARNQVWRDELQQAGWLVLEPVRSFAGARLQLHRHDPDLLIAELRLPDGTVLDMVRTLRLGLGRGGHAKHAQILVLTQGGPGDPLLLDALHDGADSFLDLTDPQAAPLATRAAETLAGEADIAPWIARHLLDHFEQYRPAPFGTAAVDEMISPLALSFDERLLLRQLAMGLRLADVARLEKLPTRTLAARVRAIYRKMQWDLRAGNLTLQAA